MYIRHKDLDRICHLAIVFFSVLEISRVSHFSTRVLSTTKRLFRLHLTFIRFNNDRELSWLLAGSCTGTTTWRQGAVRGVTIIQIPPILLFALRILLFDGDAPMGVAQPWPHYQSKYFIVKPLGDDDGTRCESWSGDDKMLLERSWDVRKKGARILSFPLSLSLFCFFLFFNLCLLPPPPAFPDHSRSTTTTTTVDAGCVTRDGEIKGIPFHRFPRFSFQLACFISSAGGPPPCHVIPPCIVDIPRWRDRR